MVTKKRKKTPGKRSASTPKQSTSSDTDFKVTAIGIAVVAAFIALLVTLIRMYGEYVDYHSTEFTWTILYNIFLYYPVEILSIVVALIAIVKAQKNIATAKVGTYITVALLIGAVAAYLIFPKVSNYYFHLGNQITPEEISQNNELIKQQAQQDKENLNIAFAKTGIHAYNPKSIPAGYVLTPSSYDNHNQEIYQRIRSGDTTMIISYHNSEATIYIPQLQASTEKFGTTSWGSPITVFHNGSQDFYLTNLDGTYIVAKASDDSAYDTSSRKFTSDNLIPILNSLELSN